MKDSDIICRLIYCAWIGPFPEQGDFDEFRAVLDCFARAVERENRQEQMQDIPIRPLTLTPERLLEIVKENADQATDRQTDRQTARPEPMTAENPSPQPSPVMLRAKNVRFTSA